MAHKYILPKTPPSLPLLEPPTLEAPWPHPAAHSRSEAMVTSRAIIIDTGTAICSALMGAGGSLASITSAVQTLHISFILVLGSVAVHAIGIKSNKEEARHPMGGISKGSGYSQSTCPNCTRDS